MTARKSPVSQDKPEDTSNVHQLDVAMKTAIEQLDASAPQPPAPVSPVPPTLDQSTLSAHIVHADVLANENQIKIAAYESGIITLQSELNGAEEEKNRAIAKLEEDFAIKAADLTRRIDDLTLTKEMLTGSLVVRDRRRSERDDNARQALMGKSDEQE